MWLALLLAIPRITNGVPDDGDPAVVALLDDGGATYCSGALIAPVVVLTAAHCIGPHGPASVGVSTQRIAVQARIVYPTFDRDMLRDDLALVILSIPASASPLVLPSADDALHDGDPVRIVGFGAAQPSAEAPAQKRSGTARVTGIDPTRLTLAPDPSQPCVGDSGGPVLAGDTLVAITSSGDVACASFAHATRVAPYLDFVSPHAPLEGGCSAAGAPAPSAFILLIWISGLVLLGVARRI